MTKAVTHKGEIASYAVEFVEKLKDENENLLIELNAVNANWSESMKQCKEQRAEIKRLKADNTAYEAQRISAIWGDVVKTCTVCGEIFETKTSMSNIVCQSCQNKGWEGK